MTKPNICEELEKLIDSSSLLDVVTGLEMICDEKAAHIEVNWQDKTTARVWKKASYTIGTIVHRISGLGI